MAKPANTYTWEENRLSPFDELIVSWSAARPQKGHYAIAVSLLTNEWSPWLDYAHWGSAGQFTFSQGNGACQTFQDIIDVLNGEKATGFKVRIKAEAGATLEHFRMVHSSLSNSKEHTISQGKGLFDEIHLKVPGLSQMRIPHERHRSFCSPTSMTSVINYLCPALQLSPLSFAEHVKDTAFDIYGNWIFNTAQASHLLGADWNCFAARLTSFDQILEQLQKGYPVIVSVKGPLEGSAEHYESGHLMVIIGYNGQMVHCMDPAFSSNEQTHVSYALEDFLSAWSRRRGLAYLIKGVDI